MDVQVVSLAPISVVMLRHQGPYDGIGDVFDRLWNWVDRHRVPAGRTIGIYWDNPDFVAASRLRSAACVEVPESYMPSDRDGLALERSAIAGGEYATTRFVGAYEDLAPVWTEMTRRTEKTLRRRIGENPAFEVYVNDASQTAPQDLITDLYMPVL